MAFFKASASDIERFNKYFRSTDPSKCWEWNGAHHPKGYGTFRLAKTSVPAHRFAYALTHNMFIPDGMVIDEFFSPQTRYFNAGLGRSRLCIW